MSDLAGKVALVIGATSDVGLAISLALAEAGATVHATGRRSERLAALHGSATAHVLDLADADGVQTLLTGIQADVLVLNAAHESEAAPFLEGGMSKLRPIMEINFFAAAAVCLRLLPGMVERGWGRVLAVGSLAASLGEAHGPAYCASKAALEGLFRNLAIDYSRHGITFNTVAPGPIATERLARWGPTKARRLAMATANRRVASPEDVAHAVRFLASPAAGHITGEELRLDGGLHLGNPPMYVREPDRGT
ncbi:MAG: SDR family oxidoreductase [Candidatus Sericytochromatia bacterium]|nr:SDR family oxidoreductase [Candidatus Tanganyikabacteria bacterium]